MRRLLAVLVSCVLVGLALVGVTSTTAAAAGQVTGRLVDAVDPAHPAVVGATVRLRTVTEGGPGAIVDTDVTSSTGGFALDAGPEPEDEYYVQVVADRHQGGFVGGGWVQPTPEYAATFPSDKALGKIRANPAFIRGVLVNARTGSPVSGVKVTARSDNDLTQFEGSDTTGPKGVFLVRGIECEDDCYLKFAGAPKGYENGFRSCAGGVVATFADACASPLGSIGKVRIKKL